MTNIYVFSLLSWPWLDKYAALTNNSCRFRKLLISSSDGVCPPLLIHPMMEGDMTIYWLYPNKSFRFRKLSSSDGVCLPHPRIKK